MVPWLACVGLYTTPHHAKRPQGSSGRTTRRTVSSENVTSRFNSHDYTEKVFTTYPGTTLYTNVSGLEIRKKL